AASAHGENFFRERRLRSAVHGIERPIPQQYFLRRRSWLKSCEFSVIFELDRTMAGSALESHRSEQVLQRKLDQPRSAYRRGNWSRPTRRRDRSGRRIRKRRMIQEVEEVRSEANVLFFRNLKHFPQSEIHILLRRTQDAVSRRVSVECSI